MQDAQTIVVGGGAAGMMAAISAAAQGERVTVLEANRQLGRKILISGNGRCNLTNLDGDRVVHYHGENPHFIRGVLEKFTVEETLRFFSDMGVVTREEKRGRLFPTSDQAQSVVDLFADRLEVLGVDVVKQAPVSALKLDGDFSLSIAHGRTLRARRVVLASGGISLAKLGANRSGLDMAVAIGHTCTDLHPGLVPLVSPDSYLHRMQGAKLTAAVAAVIHNRTIVDTDDLLFAKYGVSGFTILNLSVQVVKALASGPMELKVNMLPGKSTEQVSEVLKERWQNNPHHSLLLSFAGMLSSKVVAPLLEKSELAPEMRVARVSKAQRWKLAKMLTSLPIVVTGPRPFDYAEVTVGGIETGEVNPETLESYIAPGLYFAGEMLDVQGDLGGYNFQWAWSSGQLAGQGRSG